MNDQPEQVYANFALDPALQGVRTKAEQAIFDGERSHSFCNQALKEATEHAVPQKLVPLWTPMIYIGRQGERHVHTFAKLYMGQLQFQTLTTESYPNPEGTSRIQTSWKAKPEYLAEPVTMGLLWGKPRCYLMPLQGITPTNWQALYPSFHYTRQDHDKIHSLCVGREFSIGEAAPPEQIAGRLVALLGTVNMSDPMNRLSNVALDMPGSVWEAWAKAYAQIIKNQDQDVFVPVKPLHFAS